MSSIWFFIGAVVGSVVGIAAIALIKGGNDE